MEQLSWLQSSELNISLRKIQDSFDDAISETGTLELALQKLKVKFLDKNNKWVYKLYKTERLNVYITWFNLNNNYLCIDMLFTSRFSTPSLRFREFDSDDISLLSNFSKKRDYWEWRNFADKYYKNNLFQDIERENDIKLNQLDIETVIMERDKIAQEYLNFVEKGYGIALLGALIYKEFQINYFVRGKMTNTYIPDIYKHILADFREGNNCDRRFVIQKKDREIIITFWLKAGEISINFQNTTFQEAEEYYTKVEKRIIEIKEIIKLRSQVSKLIKSTQWNLFRNLLDIYPLSSPKESYPNIQVLYDIKKLFEQIKSNWEKRESEIMLIFIKDLMCDIQNEEITTEIDIYNLMKKIQENDITAISTYYETRLLDFLLKEESNEEIENIIEIYRKLHKYFDDEREEIEKVLVRVVASYVTQKGINNIDKNIIQTISKIVKGNILDSSTNFYNQLYRFFVNMDISYEENDRMLVDLEKYKLFNESIWINNSPISLVEIILVPIFVSKIKDDITNSSSGEINIDIAYLKSRLVLPDCKFYKRLFSRISQNREEKILEQISKNLIDIVVEEYKDSNMTVKLSLLDRLTKIRKYLDIDTKEKFVKEILHKTIVEQTKKNVTDYNLARLKLNNIPKKYEIYRKYMEDKYVDYYINKIIK